MNKKYQLTILILAVIVIVSGLTAIAYYTYNIRETKKVDMSIKVGEAMGFNTDKEALNFGTAVQGTAVERNFNIKAEEDSRVVLETKGDISNFVTFSDNNFLILRNESKKITVKAAIPEDAEKKTYNGTLIIRFYKP